MSRITDLLDAGTAKRLLEQHSKEFGAPVLLLDGGGNVCIAFPEDVSYSGLITRPLNLRDEIIGYVAVPDEYGAIGHHLDLLCGSLTVVMGMGYEIESLSGEVARNYEEISLLWKLSSRLGAGLDVDTICRILADEVMNFCPVRNLGIFLVSEMPSDILVPAVEDPQVAVGEGGEISFFPKICIGEHAGQARMMTLSTSEGLIKYVFGKKAPVTTCDLEKDGMFNDCPYPMKTLLVTPLIVENTMIGAVIASDKLDGQEFYSTEIKLIFNIASECAISIRKAFFFEEIRSMLFSTAEAFSLAIDAKDAYTYGHSRRVAEISVAVADRMGLTPEAVSWTRLAALLHDIGKIGTPESILNKNGGLDSEEQAMMQKHSVTGEKMIRHIPRFRELSRWIRYHHEKYDGSGYPEGISGLEIPLISRIITVADCYDALTTDRPYRKAYDRREAVRLMSESAGIQFDPVIFSHFEKVVT